MSAIGSSSGYLTQVIGESFGPHPVWPNDRDMQTIYSLHEFNDEETLEYCPNIANLADLIPENGTLLDMGCGVGAFAKEVRQLRPDVTIIGASCHDVAQENLSAFNRLYYGPIPENRQLLQDYTGRVDLIVDTYGPMSFADNPVHVMAFAGLLLKNKGLFTSITSETSHQKSRSVLGAPEETWAKVKTFMKGQLDCDVTIIPSKIKSQVFQRTIQRDYIIRMKRRKASLLGASQFPDICRVADGYIGTPRQGSVWWGPEDAPNFSIKEKQWAPLPSSLAA